MDQSQSAGKIQAAAPAAAAQDFSTGKVTFIGLAHATHDTYTAFLPALLPVLIEKFAMAKTEASLLTVFMQSPSLLQPFIGYLADRKGLRFFVSATPAIAAILMSLLGIMPSYILVAILLLVVGINSAVLHATGPVLAGRLSGQRLGMGMSFWMVGGEFGRSLGPVIIAAAVTNFGVERTPAIAVIGVLVSIVVYFQLRNVKELPASAKVAMPWKQALIQMRAVLLPMSGIMLLRSFSFVTVGTFLPTFLTEKGADLVIAGASLSIMEAAGVVGAFLGGSLSDRIGRRLVMAVSMVCTAVFIGLLLVTQGWLQIPVLLGLGFTSLALTPPMMAAVQESYPENRALSNGIYMAVNFAGSAIGALVVGILADAYSMQFAYVFSAVMVVIALPFLWLLPNKKRVA